MRLVLHFLYAIPIIWFLRKDTRRRPGVSGALWIPTAWVGIISTKSVAGWIGGGGSDSLDGSPVDALFFFAMIAAAFFVLVKRQVNWGDFIVRNWSILLFYVFLLISVLWANSPFSSLKRWIKEFGNIIIVLVILTEANPPQAVRLVFIRCAYAFLPLSVIYVRYFPDLGRRYSIGGGLEVTGVTTQKNTLGMLVALCLLMLLWDWMERRKSSTQRLLRIERYLYISLFVIGGYLLYQSNSQTSLMCLIIGAVILACSAFRRSAQLVAKFGVGALAGAVSLFVLGAAGGFTESLVSSMGRDMTFTGRTDVWRELLALKTNPVIGVGFMSIWDDIRYLSKLPDWASGPAHNGYLEIFIAGGAIGVGFLAIMILATAVKVHLRLQTRSRFSFVMLGLFVIALISNYSESNFAFMTPVGFMFLVASIGSISHISNSVPVYGHPRRRIEDENLTSRFRRQEAAF